MSRIEGVPEGWELVRIGHIEPDEWYVNHLGNAQQHKGARSGGGYAIIRRIEPVCTWQHGVFKDGWVTQDGDGKVWFWQGKPDTKEFEWLGKGHAKWMCPLAETAVVFRSDLPWTDRIQKVGPTIEATLKETT